jgi:hypothetical protein
MITEHAKQRMVERQITRSQIEKALKRGKAHRDDFGRPWVRRVVWQEIVVIADVVKRDILTVYRLSEGKDYV